MRLTKDLMTASLLGTLRDEPSRLVLTKPSPTGFIK